MIHSRVESTERIRPYILSCVVRMCKFLVNQFPIQTIWLFPCSDIVTARYRYTNRVCTNDSLVGQVIFSALNDSLATTLVEGSVCLKRDTATRSIRQVRQLIPVDLCALRVPDLTGVPRDEIEAFEMRT